MAALAPGDPKLVSMIVNHLKNQGLFDQFRRDCLADVDTKPAYQNLRQRVDNFVSNHLASHTWSPHLNKNQLRNSLRQMVLQSGMLEVGVDRIISQVVDPKINHIFRPQVEKAVHEFLATLDRKEEPAAVSFVQNSEKQEPTTPGLSSSGPSTSKANDALSILDTITSLNQEASAARSTVENSSGKNGEKSSKKNLISEISKSQQSFDLGMEKDRSTEETEKLVLETKADDGKFYSKPEGSINALIPVKDFEEKDRKTENVEGSVEDMNEKKDKIDEKKMDKKEVVVLRRDEHPGLSKEERKGKGKECESVSHIIAALTIKQTAKENLKKEYSLEDSDFEGLSDITVSSVHTSDLSSFDEGDDDEEEGEVLASDSTEDNQEQSSEEKDTKLETNEEEQKEGKAKPGRHPYVHKPFLYSKYYSDSDDEETVVQRRQSIAKEKAERLLRRQWNRERVEDKHKHVETEKGRPPEETLRDEECLQTLEQGINSSSDVEMTSRKMQHPTVLISKVNKATLKEQKVLEKKVALRRKRKGDSRTISEELALHHEDRKRKREQPEVFKEGQIKTENKEKAVASSTSKDSKCTQSIDLPPKPVRRLSESIQLNDSRNELKIDREPCRKQLRSNSSSQDSVMEALEVTEVDKHVNDFGIEENMSNKESPKQNDEIKHIKESDGEMVMSESDSRTQDIHTDADQKLGDPSEEKAMTDCRHVILSKSDNKALVSSTNSADSSIIEHSQDPKSREHSKVKEEKGNEKGKEKRHDAESSWSKSRESTQEDTKGHEKNKEKRNESESTRPKFKENTQEDAKANEKGKEKRNDSENPRSKLKENAHEDAKSHEKSKEKKNEFEHSRSKYKENAQDDKSHERGKEKRNEFEHSRTKSKENAQEDKSHERGKERRNEFEHSRTKSKENAQDDKGKEKRNESERSRSRSKESLQEDVKGHEKGKERRGDSGSSRSKSREKMQEDTRSHEKGKEIRNDSESFRSKSRENLQDDVRIKEKRKNFENSRSKSKEDLQEDKGNEKRIERRHDSESSRSKSKESVENSRSKSKESVESSRSKSKEDIEHNQKGIEKRHDSETTRSKSKEHSEISRSKSGEKLQGDVQYNEKVEKRHDSENTRSKSKENFESSRSKSREKVREVVQGNERGMEKKHDSENTGSKPKDHSESSQSRFKEKVQEDVQGNEKGIEKRHDSENMHFENSRSRSKEDLQEDKVNEKKIEKRHDFENTRSKSREHSEHSRSKSKEHSESSRSKYKEKVQEDIQINEKGIEKKHNSENSRSKSREHSESSRSKSKEKGQETVQDSEKGKEKKNDFHSIRSKSKEYSENVQAKSKEKPPCSEKGIEKKGNFENIRSRSREKVQDIKGNEKLKERESESQNSLTKPTAIGHEEVQSSEKRSKLENFESKSEENGETAKGSRTEESNAPENGQSESKAHMQEDIKSVKTEKEKKNGSENSESKLKEQHMKDNDKTNNMGKNSENSVSTSKEEVQDDQSNAKKGTDMENSQLKSKESTSDTKEIAHSSTGDLKMETEKSMKTEDKLEERKETFESEGSEARHMKDMPIGEKELEAIQNKTSDCRAALLEKEQTEEPAHDQVARPKELNIPLKVEEPGSLLSPYEAISPDTPTLDDAGLLHLIADTAQFVHYNPSSPATPTLDENFSYEAPSVAQDVVEPSVEDSGKQEVHSSENIKEDLHDEQHDEEQDTKLDTKCDPSKVEIQDELPVQQDAVSEINTSGSCEWKDEDVEEQSVKGIEEQNSSLRERKPKRPYTPVENLSKRRHLHSEEKSAVEDKDTPKPVEAVLVQEQDEERPTQSRGKMTSKLEEKARSQTSDLSVQNKPTTRAAKKISSPEHLPVTERERRSSTSAKEKPASDSKAGKSSTPVSVTRSRSQPSPVTKQGRKREASPGERRRGQHKIEKMPPKRTRR
ncbi:biorientation of chromosomes in cell division protein 1-like 1 [Heptranchias perlo]|uniref:biorientation of chromosomes in cell division protein 1-like 1 n=1 Tax=Heptranchias perlo TaxID=212740 RepID=UPI00355952C0